ncbi:MAG: recombinase family protein [Pseudomonadota bacterium]
MNSPNRTYTGARTLTSLSGRLIGYARVSTEDQKLDLQLDALSRAGCEKVFRDHGVSAVNAERPGLEQALHTLVEGDTLVVYRLDRLGRSVLSLADLITRLDNEGVQFCSLMEGINTTTTGGKLAFHLFAAIAEFERGLIRERTCAGLKAARERGVAIGRPRRLSDQIIIEAHRWMNQGGKSLGEAADRYNVSDSTMQRGLKRLGLFDAA